LYRLSNQSNNRSFADDICALTRDFVKWETQPHGLACNLVFDVSSKINIYVKRATIFFG
jgi:hypothetical protein